MTTQHTPGPWSYSDGHATTWAVYAMLPIHPGTLTRDFPAAPRPVAEIPRPDNDERGYEEADANARLIAAAPELLEALQGMMGLGDPDHHSGCPCWECAALSKARAVIAKATKGGGL